MFISFCTFAFGPPGRVDSLLKPHYVRWMVPRSRPCGSRLETQRDWSSLVNELFRLARLELKGRGEPARSVAVREQINGNAVEESAQAEK
jgi:hypothetical protein